jgi:hypothetical protein
MRRRLRCDGPDILRYEQKLEEDVSMAAVT